MLVTLTARGEELMGELFPLFNAQEAVSPRRCAPPTGSGWPTCCEPSSAVSTGPASA